jgi:hypothetical protein
MSLIKLLMKLCSISTMHVKSGLGLNYPSYHPCPLGIPCSLTALGQAGIAPCLTRHSPHNRPASSR